MTAREEYIRALFQLSRNTHPETWERFVTTLTAYTMEHMEKVILNTPTLEAHIAIGYMRHMREFRDEVKTIDVLYEKMDKGQTNKGVERERSNVF